MVALNYLKTMKMDAVKARFDVVSILAINDDDPQVEIVKNAFDLAYE